MKKPIDTNAETQSLEAIIANSNNTILCSAKWHALYHPVYQEAIRNVCTDQCDGYNNKCKQYLKYTTMLEKRDNNENNDN